MKDKVKCHKVCRNQDEEDWTRKMRNHIEKFCHKGLLVSTAGKYFLLISRGFQVFGNFVVIIDFVLSVWHYEIK
jgi:hypothetical protein